MDVMCKNTWTKLFFFLLTATPLMSAEQGSVMPGEKYFIENNVNTSLWHALKPNINETDVYTCGEVDTLSCWVFELIPNTTNEYKIKNALSHFLLAINTTDITPNGSQVIVRTSSKEDDADIWYYDTQLHLKNKLNNQYMYASTDKECNPVFTRPLPADDQHLFKWQIKDCTLN